MLVDSHCHLDCLDLDYFQMDLPPLLDHAREQGVIHFLCVCVDLEHFPDVLAIAERFPDVSASLGIHPTEAMLEEPTLERLIQLATPAKIVAIGETGLDYHHTTTGKTIQQTRFRQHIQLALAVNKPLIIHARDANTEIITLLKEEGAQKVGGVLHCFTGDIAMATAAIEMGFYISFSGIVTFKNARELQSVARQLPLERILIETDSPYLTPMPFRGKPNHPGHVRYVAEKLAELHGLPLEKVADQTTQNFFTLFHPQSC